MLSSKDGQVAFQRTNRDDEDWQFLLNLEIDQSVEEGVDYFADIFHIDGDCEVEPIRVLALTHAEVRFWIVVGNELFEFV